ncbi:MAG: methylated-DNA--[protein]-cysteine S-methyltransferase, partial [Candidatus Eremiobacteraeota bacterium]|nr:methylated-DNA--[protein]-cysteine S-methyltransferase [Candidatus Eremiobacteraeota bacterium]
MTERLRHCIEGYREQTRHVARPDFTAQTLDRCGLADRYATIESPIGPVYVAWNPRGVSAVRQADDAEAFERWFRRRFSRRAMPVHDEPEILDLVRRALRGEKVELEIDLRDCTHFEAAVLRKAREIPRGHARPYAWVAREIGNPR